MKYNFKRNRRVKLPFEFKIIFMTICILSIVTEMCFLKNTYEENLQKEKNEASIHGERIIAAIQEELTRCVDTTEILNDLYKTYGNKFLNSFEKLCPKLLEDNLAIGSMYFAPKGVILYGYPDEIDDATLLFNMIKDPIQGPKSKLAIQSKKVTIAGPHSLVEGGEGFIVRNPIFDDKGDFEAFTITVIDKNSFVDKIIEKLSKEEKEYKFGVWKDEDDTAVLKDGFIFVSKDTNLDKSIVIPFEAPNDKWYLTLEPVDGWNPMGGMLISFIVSVFLVSALLSALFLIVRLNVNESEKLRLEENNDIMSNAGMGVWRIIVENGKRPRMKANPKMLELLGIDNYDMPEEDVYSAWYSRINDEDINSVTNSVNEMLSGKKSENTYRWRHPLLGERYVRCGGTSYNEEKIDGYIIKGYHYDVTNEVKLDAQRKNELEKAKNEAEQASAAKTSFLFNMSHDIRTPMNAIIGFTELVEKNQNNPDKLNGYVSKIKESSSVLLSIINNVLEMARIEKGSLILDEQVWGVKQYNDSISVIFEELMEQKNIDFKRTIDVKHEYVLCDSIKLREIFLNILSNAFKYTPSGGKIVMELKEIESDREGYAMFQTCISDTGIGMSKDFLPHIFEEFSRENNTTQAKIEGTGLGMPIVKKLLDFMEGTISVESELGKGTTFIVTIPHKIATMEQIDTNENNTENELERKKLRNKKILLAEDNDFNAEIIMEILGEADIEVTRVCDGVECVNMIKEKESDFFDLILMDIQMPNMNGYVATMTIRELSDVKKSIIPIVAMTANAFDEDKKEAFRVGMDGHISKPIAISELFNILSSILK